MSRDADDHEHLRRLGNDLPNSPTVFVVCGLQQVKRQRPVPPGPVLPLETLHDLPGRIHGDACERLESTDRHPHDASLGLTTSFPEEPTENRTAPKQAA